MKANKQSAVALTTLTAVELLSVTGGHASNQRRRAARPRRGSGAGRSKGY